MEEFLPKYRRGESLAGYISRCSATRRMTTSVPSQRDRVGICQEHALQSRELLRQPFAKPKKP